MDLEEIVICLNNMKNKLIKYTDPAYEENPMVRENAACAIHYLIMAIDYIMKGIY